MAENNASGQAVDTEHDDEEIKGVDDGEMLLGSKKPGDANYDST